MPKESLMKIITARAPRRSCFARPVTGFLLAVLLGLNPALASAQPIEPACYENKFAFNILLENDLWGSGSDKHFTNGGRLSLLVAREPVMDAEKCLKDPSGLVATARLLADSLSWDALGFKTRQVSLIFGQNIFTPEDISRSDLILNDRPYAGWLYLGFGLIAERAGPYNPVDTYEFDLGVIGPWSQAEAVQKNWHEFIDTVEPKGWDHQLSNEVGVLLNLERKWKLPLPMPGKEGLELDFLPSAGIALGNVFTYASAGGMLRLGVNLKVDYGPPRIRPGAQGSDFFKTREIVGWYVFAGVEGRAVARNIFLDGNTFEHSHSVDKKYFVGDLHVGLVVVIDCFRLAFTNVFRTEEFSGQGELDEFGSVSASWTW